MAMTKMERDMMTDVYRFIDAHVDDYQLSKYEGIIDEYKQLWEKYKGHPMIRGMATAAVEYLEKRWKHVYGEAADR